MLILQHFAFLGSKALEKAPRKRDAIAGVSDWSNRIIMLQLLPSQRTGNWPKPLAGIPPHATPLSRSLSLTSGFVIGYQWRVHYRATHLVALSATGNKCRTHLRIIHGKGECAETVRHQRPSHTVLWGRFSTKSNWTLLQVLAIASSPFCFRPGVRRIAWRLPTGAVLSLVGFPKPPQACDPYLP